MDLCVHFFIDAQGLNSEMNDIAIYLFVCLQRNKNMFVTQMPDVCHCICFYLFINYLFYFLDN